MKNNLLIVAALVAIAQLTMVSGLSVSAGASPIEANATLANPATSGFPMSATTFAAPGH